MTPEWEAKSRFALAGTSAMLLARGFSTVLLEVAWERRAFRAAESARV